MLGIAMGLLLTWIYNALQRFYGLKARILLLGLNNAGKTTLLYRLKLNEAVSVIPTGSYNVETIQSINNVTFTMWDVGGHHKITSLWTYNTDGLVFVVDSMDSDYFCESRFQLQSLLGSDDLEGVPLVLLANKQDLPGARPPMEVAEKVGLTEIRGHRWHVQGCSAVNGQGIPEAMEMLSEIVKLYRKARGHTP